MEWNQGIFACKLCELEQEYGRLQSRIHLFQHKNTKQAQKELDRLQDEYQERKWLLQERVRASRSPSVAALAKAQAEYGQQAEHILKEELPAEMGGRNQSPAADRAEAVALYAEYAMDFATQAMGHALIAALSAMVLQDKAEAQEGAGQQKGEGK